MFRGASKITLDNKGRMAIPTRYRDGIIARSLGSLVATIDRDPCLLIYPLPDWEEMERRLMRLSGNKPAIRAFQRRVVGHAAELDMDSHGRVLIPRELRDIAGLNKQAMLIGQGNKFELWDEGRWAEWMDKSSGGDGLDLPPELESLPL
ncbi:MAG: cell division/cell wall cluster transcriptional repressor MraZ [Chromatiales bacterium]|jgi:MraZ protein|nr:cell division/cell wall cluster transcriptional repressor MraZ [Chromatiales bacterium]MDP6151608.1 division/cell wall cluster transcriptional repressor MraZ [Gammaproteobacteria bacterium]MDP7270163.1 division/cell wall cluster transcriptional repressor MraZ [Gammaproteobacteria bacterium]HJP04791.1 division/cell wall cluster transcriptional repressor MraZ [Gammaproteobacteria bacterium]